MRDGVSFHRDKLRIELALLVAISPYVGVVMFGAAAAAAVPSRLLEWYTFLRSMREYVVSFCASNRINMKYV